MDIKFNPAAIKISAKLMAALKRLIKERCTDVSISHITINYRDSEYSCEGGGYHPVEISFQKDASTERWNILYITDFSYYGYPYAELIKDLDFDFSLETFFAVYCPPRLITDQSAKEVYRLWEYNFLCYVGTGAFDQITVSTS
jgi:hypothetical protein